MTAGPPEPEIDLLLARVAAEYADEDRFAAEEEVRERAERQQHGVDETGPASGQR